MPYKDVIFFDTKEVFDAVLKNIAAMGGGGGGVV